MLPQSLGIEVPYVVQRVWIKARERVKLGCRADWSPKLAVHALLHDEVVDSVDSLVNSVALSRVKSVLEVTSSVSCHYLVTLQLGVLGLELAVPLTYP